jgi:hypothetical protein
VRAYSKETLVELGRQRRDQLALTGKKRGWPAHHALGESRQMVGSLGLEGEEMEDLRNWDSRPAHLTENRGVWLGWFVLLDRAQVHRLHSDPLEAAFYVQSETNATPADGVFPEVYEWITPIFSNFFLTIE